MIVHREVIQGSAEWLGLHVGKSSAGGYKRIITPKDWRLSASANGYRDDILTDWWFGELPESVASAFMARGLELEARARAWYEFEREVNVEQVGFVEIELPGGGWTGYSPDGWVGDDGTIEIKILEASNHLSLLIDGVTEPRVREYLPQIMGGLWIGGRKWCDLVFWHPTWPSVIHRVERDAERIKTLSEVVTTFNIGLESAKQRLVEIAGPPRQTFCPVTGARSIICRHCREET